MRPFVSISALLFDAGDILYAKPNREPEVARFLAERGYEARPLKDPVERAKRLEAHAGKIGVDEFMEWLMRHYGVSDPQDIADGVALLKTLQSDVVFFDGVGDTLHELKRRGYKLGVVTNTFNPPSEKAEWFRTIGIDGLWDSYADSCELGVVKPDPRIYLAALAPLGLKPEDAGFVGHAQVELDGAAALGMTTIRFNPDPDCHRADFTAARFSDLLKLAPFETPRAG